MRTDFCNKTLSRIFVMLVLGENFFLFYPISSICRNFYCIELAHPVNFHRELYVINIFNFRVYFIRERFLLRPSTIREHKDNKCKRAYKLTIVWTQILSVISLKFLLPFIIREPVSYHTVLACNSNNHFHFFTTDTKGTVLESESNQR